jgi:Flp pilus assembly protein TadB
VSRDRARRRAAREQQRAQLVAERARRVAAEQRRRARRERLLGWVPKPSRRPRPASVLASRRRTRRAVVVLAFAAVQVLTWLLTADWWHRVAVLAVSVLALPVLVTLVYDRRSARP